MTPAAYHCSCVIVLDRGIGRINPGIEEDVDVDAAGRDDPEEKEAERAEIEQRVPRRREGAAEDRLGSIETAAYA
jgi:hypothetical protein